MAIFGGLRAADKVGALAFQLALSSQIAKDRVTRLALGGGVLRLYALCLIAEFVEPVLAMSSHGGVSGGFRNGLVKPPEGISVSSTLSSKCRTASGGLHCVFACPVTLNPLSWTSKGAALPRSIQLPCWARLHDSLRL
jgi:hypothetical protein